MSFNSNNIVPFRKSKTDKLEVFSNSAINVSYGGPIKEVVNNIERRLHKKKAKFIAALSIFAEDLDDYRKGRMDEDACLTFESTRDKSITKLLALLNELDYYTQKELWKKVEEESTLKAAYNYIVR